VGSRLSALIVRLRGLLDLGERKLLLALGNDFRVRRLRARGVKIGENCLVYTTEFSSEPYLVEIGDHVAISSGVKFITHDASIWLFEDTDPEMDLFGPIHVGDNVYFGLDCLVLPNSRIGSNCIIGAGTIVRGNVPDNSVVMGNPGRVVMKTTLVKPLMAHHRNRLDTRHLPPREKERAVRAHFGKT
jgi:acetyltransferase-like isoleucine patch superfamily enzyme